MSSPAAPKHIAIIGAGLAGLTLALSLQASNIPCTIYELRSASSAATAGGAIMLSPNALRILDALSLYKPLTQHGWSFESLHYVDESAAAVDEKTGTRSSRKVVGRYDLGNEAKYGYKALRIYRSEVLRALHAACIERGVTIEYERKYVGVKESGDKAVVEFADGGFVEADLVVGADGIHSSVRKHVVPEVTGPIFSGMTAVTGAVDRKDLVDLKLSDGSDLPMPVNLQGEHGAFVFAPQNPAASEMLCGTQFKYPEQTREGWKKLLGDKEQIRKMLGHDDAPSELVKSAVANAKEDTLNVWAFYVVPKLRTWASEEKRVVILGDAAHAIPPTAGQGATQAFEDGYSLAALLKVVVPGMKGWGEALQWWQGVRGDRVQKVLDLTARLNNSRLPKEEREKLPMDKLYSSDNQEDLSWLYNHKVDEEVRQWAKSDDCPVHAWLKSFIGGNPKHVI